MAQNVDTAVYIALAVNSIEVDFPSTMFNIRPI